MTGPSSATSRLIRGRHPRRGLELGDYHRSCLHDRLHQRPELQRRPLLATGHPPGGNQHGVDRRAADRGRLVAGAPELHQLHPGLHVRRLGGRLRRLCSAAQCAGRRRRLHTVPDGRQQRGRHHLLSRTARHQQDLVPRWRFGVSKPPRARSFRYRLHSGHTTPAAHMLGQTGNDRAGLDVSQCRWA